MPYATRPPGPRLRAARRAVAAAITAAAAAAAIAVLVAVPAPARAADYTWNGDSHGDPNWSNPDNWGGVVPVSGATTNIIFGDETLGAVAFQNIANPFVFSGMTFAPGGGSYVVRGNRLEVGSVIDQFSASPIAIENDLQFSSISTIRGFGGSGPLALSGKLSGTSLTTNTTGSVSMSGGGGIGRLNVQTGTTLVTANILAMPLVASVNLSVGSLFGPALLSITSGGRVNSGIALIEGATATASIDGVGSIFNPSELRVAFTGGRNGRVNVSDGGTLLCPNVSVASAPASIGDIDVFDGGVATMQGVTIGSVGGNGTLRVRDPGSSATMSSLNVRGATGLVYVEGGGAVAVSGAATIGSAGSTINVENGSFTAGGLASSGVGSVTLADPSGALALNLNAASGFQQYDGAISGSGGVRKSGASTQFLTGANTYTGETIVDGGILALGSGKSSSYTANGGTLHLMFGDLGFSSLRANPGGTIYFATNTVVGGFFRGGGGTYGIQAVTSFNGSTFGPSMALTLGHEVTLRSVTNSGALTNNVPLAWDGGVNSAAGRVTVNAQLDTNDFENDGTITVNGGGTLSNSGTNLVSGGGSSIRVNAGGVVRLNGTTLDLHGALLVNNGELNGTTNVYFGSLAAGEGKFKDVVVHPGGAYTPGVTLANAPPPAPVSTGLIRPLDANQTSSAAVVLAADTTATVTELDQTLAFANPMAAPGKTLTKTGGGTLVLTTLDAGGLAVNEGSVKIQRGATAIVSRVAALSTAGGTVDLTNSHLIVPGGDVGTSNGTTYDGLTGMIQSAYQGGTWDGATGVTTSMPSALDGLTTLAIATAAQVGLEKLGGVALNGDDAIVIYTYAGDTNVDGQISGDDYGTIDFSILVPGADGYYNGDFNYDGVINGDDYGVIDFTIIAQGDPFPMGVSATSAPSASVTAVPEPAACGFAVLAAAGVFTSRRRRRART